jgi:hypothetical protein
VLAVVQVHPFYFGNRCPWCPIPPVG